MYFTVCLVLFCFVFSSSSFCKTQAEVQNQQKALRNELFRNRDYDRMVRPVENHTETVQTSVNLTLLNIKALNNQESVFESTVIIKISWTDPFLAWKPSEFDGIERIVVDMNEVYLPDVTLANSVDGANLIRTSTHSNLILYSTGSLLWFPVIATKTLCTVNLTDWPFDRQTCSYKFYPWINHAGTVNLSSKSIDGIDLSSYVQTPEWKIISTNAKMQYESYSCCSEIYPSVEFGLTIERTATLYRYTIHWPLIATLMINLMSLLLDIRDNIRFQASCVSLMLLVLLVIYIEFKLGLGTTGTPKVIIYLGQMIILVTCTIVWFFIGRILMKSTMKVPTRLIRALKPIYGIKERNDFESVELDNTIGIEEVYREPAEGEFAKEAQTNFSIDKLIIIYVIDRLLFVVSLLLMILLHN